MKKRIWIVLFAIMMIAVMLSVLVLSASADNSQTAVGQTNHGLLWKKVWYFNREYTIIEDCSNGYNSGYVTLLPTEYIALSAFDERDPRTVWTSDLGYAHSTVKSLLDTMVQPGGLLEKEAFAMRTVDLPDEGVYGVKCYLLNANEAKRLPQSVLDDGSYFIWWLRDTDAYHQFASDVAPGSDYNEFGYGFVRAIGDSYTSPETGKTYPWGTWITEVQGVRPVFQIDLSKAPYDPEQNALLYSLDMTNYGAHISTDATVNYLQNDLIYRGYRGEIKPIKFTTGSGYMFPETSECYKTVNGITVARTGDREITVSGSLTGNVNVEIPDVYALPATAPVITAQPTGFETTYLEASPATSVTATAAEGHTLSYTWYYSTVNSNTGGSWAGNGASCGINTQDYGPGAGTYYMYCVVTATRNDNGQTASVVSDTAEVVMKKAKGEIQYGLYYDKIDKMVGDPDFTNYIYYVGYGYRSYTSSNPNVATVNPNTGMVSIVGVGETTITCTIQDGYNWYFEPNTTSYHLTVRDYISVTATGYSGYWDGREHGITVNVTTPASGYTVKYGVNWYGPFEPEFESNFMYDSSPTMSNIGGATIYYRVTAPYYVPYIGSAGISIAQKGQQEISDVEGSIEVTYGAGPMQLHPTVSGNHGAPDGKLTYSVSGDAVTVDQWGFVTFRKAGSATIHLNVSETEAYLGTQKNISVVVKRAPSTAATLTPTNFPYNGTERPLVTVDESTLVGGTMEYALGTSATTAPTEGWSADIPTATEVGSYYVWNRVVPDENHLESVSCVIANVLTDYIEHAYENGKVTEARHDMPYNITFLHSQYMPDYLSDGWYFLWKDATCGNITTSGDVHLVLEDGATLSCGTISIGGTLSVYGRDEGSGKLNAAAISGGTLLIHGGEVSATQAYHDAAISSGNVTIYAGSLTAISGLGAGIGGGVWNGYNGTVRIYGGSVYAQNTPLPEAGFTDGEGIGAGCNGSGSGTLILGPGVGLVDGDGYTLAAPSEQEQMVTTRTPIMKTGIGIVVRPVTYRSATYNENTGKVEFTENTVSDYKLLSSQTNWKDGWFVVDKDVTFTTDVTIEGTVNLIICDGATLTLVESCIELEDGDTLNIYGGAQGTGKLIIGDSSYNSGIGCYYDEEPAGTLTVHGCDITALGGVYKGAPGIGVKDVTIYAGSVTATGFGGAGIGSARNIDYTGTVRIYGGEVNAISNPYENDGAQGNGIGAGAGGQEEVAVGPQITVTASQITVDMASSIHDVSDMPDDFVQTDLSIAKAWADAPQGFLHLLYAVDENWMYVVDYLDGKSMSGGYYFRASDLSRELSFFFGRDEAVYYVTDYSSIPVENDRFTLILGAGIGLVDGKGKTIAEPLDEVRIVTARNSTMKTGVEVPPEPLEPVSYLENGTERSCENYKLFDNSTTELEDGWYVVNGTVTVSDRISVSGDVKLILCDGAQLVCEKGIALTDGNTLSIYGQTAGSGKLTAASDEYEYAAIGENNNSGAGALNVYGGQIYATSSRSSTLAIGASNGSGSLYVAGGKLVLANTGYSRALKVAAVTLKSGFKMYQSYEPDPEETGDEVDEWEIEHDGFSQYYVTIVSKSAVNPGPNPGGDPTPGENTVPTVARLTSDMVRNMNDLIGDMPSNFTQIDEEMACKWAGTASGEAYLIYNTENDRYLKVYSFYRDEPMHSEEIMDVRDLERYLDRGEVYYVTGLSAGGNQPGGDEPENKTVPTAARLTRDMVQNMSSVIGDMPSDFTMIDEEIARAWECPTEGRAYLIYNTKNNNRLKMLIFDNGIPVDSDYFYEVSELENALNRGEVYYVIGIAQSSGGGDEPGTNVPVYVPTENEDGTLIYNETVTEEPKDVTDLFAQAKEESGTVEIKAMTDDNKELVIAFNADAVSAIGDANVTLSAKVFTENLPENTELVLEVTLTGATFEGGEATVSIPFEKEVPAGKVAKVYYIDDFGNKTDMNATFENGAVTFKTNHFSTYAVILEDYQLQFSAASLTLQNDLKVNFYVEKAQLIAAGFTDLSVKFEMNGKEFIIGEYREVTSDGVDYYVFSFCNIAPDRMNDKITATLYAKKGEDPVVSEELTYSIAQYCYSMLGKTEDAKLRTLLVDLLNYGAASQVYTDYQTDALVNAALTPEQIAWGTASDPVLTSVKNATYRTVNDPAVNWAGISLNLYDSITMQFAFEAESTDGVTIKVESANGTILKEISADEFTASGSSFIAKFKGLTAGDMSETVYVTAYQGEEAISNTVAYSIESYAYAKQNDTDANLAALVKTMMKYGNAAYAYVH